MGLRNGPTAWRTPDDVNTMTEKTAVIHQP